MRYLYKFYCLEPGDRAIVLQIAIALPLVALGLRTLGFKRLFVLIGGLADRLAQPPLKGKKGESIYVERVRQWIHIARRKAPYRGNCLSRSLVLWWLLRRQQIDSIIRIGTRKQNGEFQAHAWVEYGDQPLNEEARVRQNYATFDYAFTPETVLLRRKRCNVAG